MEGDNSRVSGSSGLVIVFETHSTSADIPAGNPISDRPRIPVR
jgi:hypothetical protein